MTKKPVCRAESEPHEDEERKRFKERLWKRIDEVKHRPPFRDPDWDVIIAGKIPTHTVPISATGIDNAHSFRSAERQRYFEDTLFYIRHTFANAIRNNKTLSSDQTEHINRVWEAFESNVGWLEGDIELIGAVIATAFELGTFCGEHPVKEKARIDKGRGVKTSAVERRQDILTPLILTEARINPKSINKRALGPANELLEAHGEEPISRSTFAVAINAVIKPPK